MGGLPDPDWYLDHVLVDAEPGTAVVAPPGPAAQWQAWWRAQASGSGPLTGLLSQQGFVVTAPQLLAAGISRQRARTLIRRGVWSAPTYGTIAPVDVRDPDPLLVRRRRHALAAAGAALRHDDHVVSGRSAAVLHGLPTFHVPRLPELTDAEPTGLGRRPTSHLHGATLTFDEVTNWFGTPMTTVARTVVDLARHDCRDGIMAADAALRERLVSREHLAAALDLARGWPGVRQARQVVALADPLAESPLESLTRLLMHDDGLPAPELQVAIGAYRVDMLFRDRNLILEIDGLGKYTTEELRREKRRELRLRAWGYRVERVTWDDVVRRWPQTRVWLRAALGLPA